MEKKKNGTTITLNLSIYVLHLKMTKRQKTNTFPFGLDLKQCCEKG